MGVLVEEVRDRFLVLRHERDRDRRLHEAEERRQNDAHVDLLEALLVVLHRAEPGRGHWQVHGAPAENHPRQGEAVVLKHGR